MYESADGQPTFTGHVDELVRKPLGLRLAKSPVGVADERGGRLLDGGQLRAAGDFAFAERVEVAGDAHHAVRVVPAQVGIDQTAGH